jgi:hypothetical protein
MPVRIDVRIELMRIGNRWIEAERSGDGGRLVWIFRERSLLGRRPSRQQNQRCGQGSIRVGRDQ